MKKNASKKLELNKITVQDLDDRRMETVKGGETGYLECGIHTVKCCSSVTV